MVMGISVNSGPKTLEFFQGPPTRTPDRNYNLRVSQLSFLQIPASRAPSSTYPEILMPLQPL